MVLTGCLLLNGALTQRHMRAQTAASETTRRLRGQFFDGIDTAVLGENRNEGLRHQSHNPSEVLAFYVRSLRTAEGPDQDVHQRAPE